MVKSSDPHRAIPPLRLPPLPHADPSLRAISLAPLRATHTSPPTLTLEMRPLPILSPPSLLFQSLDRPLLLSVSLCVGMPGHLLHSLSWVQLHVKIRIVSYSDMPIAHVNRLQLWSICQKLHYAIKWFSAWLLFFIFSLAILYCSVNFMSSSKEGQDDLLEQHGTMNVIVHGRRYPVPFTLKDAITY